MELTDNEIELIRAHSRKIKFGRIVINISGSPSDVVNIDCVESRRFYHGKAAPSTSAAMDRRRGGRY